MNAPIETIALILIVFSLIKIFVILVSPKSWMKFAKFLWSKIWITVIVLIALAGIVLYYLLWELTIVQILAIVAFTALLMGIGFASHVKDLIKIYEKQIKDKTFWKDGMWLYVLLWLALLIWGLIEILIY